MKAIWEKAEHAATAKVLSCIITQLHNCHNIICKSIAVWQSKHRCRRIRRRNDGIAAETLRHCLDDAAVLGAAEFIKAH